MDDASTLTIEETEALVASWRAHGERLRQRHEKLKWETIDWIVEGRLYEPKDSSGRLRDAQGFYKKCSKILGLSRERCELYARLGQEYPPDRRVKGVPLSHYETLKSAMDVDARLELLKEAKRSNLSTRRLRKRAQQKGLIEPPQLTARAGDGSGIIRQIYLNKDAYSFVEAYAAKEQIELSVAAARLLENPRLASKEYKRWQRNNKIRRDLF